MHLRRLVICGSVAAALAALVVLAGCGGSQVGAPTEAVAPGTQITARQYLAATAAEAAAARDFVTALNAAGPLLSAAKLKARSADLEQALDRASVAGRQIAGGRLADRRLEEQRQRAVPRVQAAVAAMRRAASAAKVGNPRAAARAATDLGSALDALREANTATATGTATAP